MSAQYTIGRGCGMNSFGALIIDVHNDPDTPGSTSLPVDAVDQSLVSLLFCG